MTLMKWEPLREMEDMFDRYTSRLGWPRMNQEALSTSAWSPKVDIVETDKEYLIKAELPEVNKEDVKVSIENGELCLSGERKQEKEETGKKFHRLERYHGSFMRSFSLPDNVDADNIKASFKDGMLNLSLPKSGETPSLTRAIKIQ